MTNNSVDNKTISLIKEEIIKIEDNSISDSDFLDSMVKLKSLFEKLDGIFVKFGKDISELLDKNSINELKDWYNKVWLHLQFVLSVNSGVS